MKKDFTNDLIYESSPYLLQHAHNPVDWHAWNEATLLKARQLNKPILLSIGYATCHWCHVMEHESFEDESVAKVMNKHFVCIKIDREERPDIDQIYMETVQMLTGRGGWPLHAITLPDGKPFWGAMYVPKERWLKVLEQIGKMWLEEPEKIMTYAEELTQGLHRQNTIPENSTIFSKEKLKDVIMQWQNTFDETWGGMNRAPKFPLPVNYSFLLRYAHQTQNKKIENFVHLTLQKMAFGGINDWVRGGFSRYSVDEYWHVPHFEKMLYDNAQLISLYSKAFAQSGQTLYRKVIEKTVDFVINELYDAENGCFYSALDADSQDKWGRKEEGAYYVWQEEELKTLLKDDFDAFANIFNINKTGYWEKENYVLFQTQPDDYWAVKMGLKLEELEIRKTKWQQILQQEQLKRKRPITDDKTLTSWNALMLNALTDAYTATGNEKYLQTALLNADFVNKNLITPQGKVWRTYKNGTAKIDAFLEDYALLIEAFLRLYEVTFDEKWLQQSLQLTGYVLKHFYDPESSFFFFTSDENQELIQRKIDLNDDVIPSGNSVMARNLKKLGIYFENTDYLTKSQKMLEKSLSFALQYPSGYANWLHLAMDEYFEAYEVVVVGKNALTLKGELLQKYLPNALLSGSVQKSEIPILKNRFIEEQTYIYICQNQTCLLPVTAVNQVWEKILPPKED